MKKKTTVLMVALILSCMFCCGAAGEDDLTGRIRNAQKIQWASKDYVVLDGDMIRLSDGEILFESISIVSTGNYACINTDDGIWVLDRDGNRRHLELGSDYSRPVCVTGKYGLFFGCDESNGDACWFVYDPATDTITGLPGFEGYDHIEDIYQDSEGQVYILTTDSSYYTCGIYKANGEQILEKDEYPIAYNCNYDLITNGHLTVYDEKGAAILSPFTGKVEASFPDYYWVNYDENHDIYRDNTALIGPDGASGYGKQIIGLDGVILKELSDDHYFCNRGEPNYLYGIGSLWGDGVYNWITDRTYWYEGEYSDPVLYIICEETGEIFMGTKDAEGNIAEYQSQSTGKTYSEEELFKSGEPIPERYEKYRPVFDREYWLIYKAADETDYSSYRIGITGPDGAVLGNRYWKAIADEWYRDNTYHIGGYDIGGYRLFSDAPVCAVMDENEMYTVINTKGEILLPSEYEQIDLIGSFSEDPKGNGHSLAAKKNGQWYVFDEEGKPLYSDLTVRSGEEAAKVYTSGDYEYTLLEDNTAEIKGYTGKDTELIIPSELDGKKITSIGIDSFSLNGNLTSVAVPDSVTAICDNAFSYCRNLSSIVIPNSVTSMGDAVFYKCEKLNSVRIPGSITGMGDRVFCGCENLQSAVVAEGVARIGSFTFSGCKNLKSVLLPGTLTAIGNNALENCESLKAVAIPNGVTSIGDGAFSGCSSLIGVTIPESMTSIGKRTFYNCSSLTSVTIPNSMTNIDDDAFSGCKKLESVTIPDSVTFIGRNAFEACNILTLTVSENSYAAVYGVENDLELDIIATPQPEEATNDEGSAENAGNGLPAIGDVEVGCVVTFGTYPQTGEGTDQTPIEWMVLDVKDGKALLLSKYGLDVKAYNRRWHEDVTWENCTLRKWLQKEFLKKAFSNPEQSVIVITDVDNSPDQGYSTKSFSGNDTKDQVFLLSYAEAHKYLNVTYDGHNNMKSRVTPTAYAIAQGAWISSRDKTEDDNEAGCWWLRSPGFWRGYASIVKADGSLDCYGSVDGKNGVVRPALWIDLESDLWIEEVR